MRPSTFQSLFRAPNASISNTQTTLLRSPRPFLPNRIPTPQLRTSPFSSTTQLQRRTKGGDDVDPRITLIRSYIHETRNPRPLRFSRSRFLRHWTIHRAWLLFLRKRRWAEERELERQYMAMRAACEHLRLMDESGNLVPESQAGGKGNDPGQLGPGGKEVGRLYRAAMIKSGVSVPIEYARIQSDFPSRDGWNHGWTRGS